MRKLRFFGTGLLAMAVLFQSLAFSQTSRSLTFKPTYFGMHFHRASDGTPWPGRGIFAWRLLDAGVNWFDLQPNRDMWDFRKLDRYVAMSELTGTEILLPLAFSPPWASARPREKGAYGSGAAAEPRDLNDWRVFVRTVASRYKTRIKAYEVWNEPNLSEFFSGTPETLVELQRVAYEEIKAVSPQAIVVTSAVTEDSPKSLEWFERFVKAGAGKYADVIGYHYYFPASEPERALILGPKLDQILRLYGVELPKWNTESGWQIANANGARSKSGIHPSWKLLDERVAAAYVLRALLITRFSGVERYYWYSWDHEGMGLMEPDTRTPKLAGKVFLRISLMLSNGSLESCEYKGMIWTCVVRDAGGIRFAVFWTAGAIALEVPVNREWSDEVWKPIDDVTTRLSAGASLWISSEPIFVRLKSH